MSVIVLLIRITGR